MRFPRLGWMATLALLGATGCPGERSAGDIDMDGFTSDEGDCDDLDNAVFPGAEEICDGKDNDCNDVRDDPYDLDEDGISTCGDDGEYGTLDDDCDDGDPEIYPNAEEICDGIDNDCSGRADDWPGLDDDQDGVCVEEGDCDDDDPTVFPGAAEYCNGKDNDCNGVIDDGYDDDGDGYSPCGDDCDDEDPTVHPGAEEECDGVDDDCDGSIDEDYDEDGDGWAWCSGDCDDSDDQVFPGAAEQCNDIDDNCNGQIDEEVDEDEDGYTPCGGDCDDLDPQVFPGAMDGPDGVDNDCDAEVDEFYGWDVEAASMTVTVQGAANDHLGDALAAGGDVDGDGIDDLLAGAPYSDGDVSDSGSASVVGGRTGDWFVNPPVLDVVHDIDGTVTDAHVGGAVALGDLDDDGWADVVVGAPYRPFTGVPDGEVYLYFGGPGAIGSWPSTDDADVTLTGDFPGEHAGWSVSAGGDVDGDGNDDLLVGAPYNNAEAGVPGIAYLFFGQPAWYGADGTDDADVALQGEAGHTLVGNSVAVVPDLNGDGYDEILVGGEDADGGAGRAWLVYGHGMVWVDDDLGDADAIFDASGGDGWGAHVGGCGDLDSDGRGELWIGSFGYATGGAVALFFGTASPLSGTLDLPDDADTVFLGSGGEEAAILAAPGDMDGDGTPEIAIGARGNDASAPDAGALYLVTDPAGSWPAEYELADAHTRILGEAQGDWFGHAVAAGGDLDDDGLDDLVVGAPYNDQAGSASGKVYVVYGY